MPGTHDRHTPPLHPHRPFLLLAPDALVQDTDRNRGGNPEGRTKAMIRIGRRSLLAGAATLAATGARAATAARLRMFWWGSKERGDRTLKASAAFMQANPGVTIEGETLGWGDYWTKLATQVAGRNPPDIIQMDYRYIFEYARRGTLLALDKFVPGTLAIQDFGKAADGGRVDGKLYGVNLGQNSTATFFNATAFEAAGLQPPAWDTTWDGYASLGAQLTKKAAKPGFWGLSDGGIREPLFEVFVRQRGKALYDSSGKLAFGDTDAADWFQLWTDMRKAGACVPADVAALDKASLDTTSLALGKSAVDFDHSNQLVGLQAIIKDKLGMTMDPAGGAGMKPGQYYKPSQLWSVAASTRYPEEAVRVVNFTVENPEGAKILGAERGIPASPKIRAAIAPELDPLDRMMLDYIAFIEERIGDLPPAPPNGAGEIAFRLQEVNAAVGFGKMTPKDAGKKFVDDANDILAR
jgi:multiple sugar transport system substrate-binding protein